MELTAIILAGGKSSRMGQDKGLVAYKGKLMVEYAIDICKNFTDLILISTGNENYATFGYPLLIDNFKDIGPVGGLEAGLTYSKTQDNIICPCDMPNIHPLLIETVLQKKKGNQAVVVENKYGKVIPVLGYYNKSALPVIHYQISAGNYKMRSLLEELNAKTVVFSSEGLLENVNYPGDLL